MTTPTIPNSTILSYSELEQVWVAVDQQNGTPGNPPPAVMAAIGLAESTGRINATNHNSNGTIDYGVMQVNSSHGFDAQRLMSDPVYNVQCAYSIFKSQGLGAWSTYNSGAYQKFLGSSSGTSGNTFETVADSHPKAVIPTVGKVPPTQWLSSDITKYGDFSKAKGTATTVDGKTTLSGIGSVKVIKYVAANKYQLLISTDGLNATVLDPSGKYVVGLTTPVGSVEAPIAPSVGNPLSGLAALESAALGVLKFITQVNFWKRLGLGLLAAVMLIIGVILFNEKSIAGTAKKVGASKLVEAAVAA